MSFPPPPSGPVQQFPPPRAAGSAAGWASQLRWALVTLVSGVAAGGLWRGLFGLRSPQEWGEEGFFAIDGLFLLVVVILGVAWGVGFLLRPGDVPFRRYVVLLVAVLGADLIAWQTGEVLGMRGLTAKVVLLAGPLATATIGTLGAAWHASRSS